MLWYDSKKIHSYCHLKVNEGIKMELNEEEAEVIALFLSTHWVEFSESSQEFMSIVAIHRLAKKFRLSEQNSEL